MELRKTLLFLLLLPLSCIQHEQLDSFEHLFYDPEQLLRHSRTKREIGHKHDQLQFTLSSKSRTLHLSLGQDNSVFHPDARIENSEGQIIPYDTSTILSGHLQDDPGSIAEGVITPEGYFDGFIATSDGQRLHIEPSTRHNLATIAPGIIYDENNDVRYPETPCQSHLLHQNSSSHNTHITKIKNFQKKTITRKKRYILDPSRKTCMLYLQADHLFYNHFGTESSSINMMARHIQRVNEIYSATDFDGDGYPDGLSFMIKRIKVHTNNSTPGYKYNGDKIPVIKYLEKFSEGDYESFCLAYMFTFRDFEGGTLGLAWTGDLKNAGGVCERKGHFRGGLKSLNTGIITLLNYGKVVLPAVSYVTLAHEIGHNFGSPHDPENDKECVPSGRDGNFIMYARATAGDQKNNQQFSPCSLRSIKPVLNAKARNVHGCFEEEKKAICGNREVEVGEECDCGWEEDCDEPCCWPMRVGFSSGEVPCTLKSGVDCSPSQGPCCTGNCTLKIRDKCRDDNGCRHSAFCDGYMPQCPPSVHKPNKTICHHEQNVCFRGECTGSICLAYGLESCQCNASPFESSSKMCELCCKRPGENEPCLSSFEWNQAPFDVPDLFAKPGSPCKNYTGYCDNYHACREVDPSGPLATLRNLLLADEGLTAIAQWIDTHWYAVISLVALLIVMMILTAKLCGKHAKKKLRKITVLHSNVDAIQVERSYWDESGEHVVHPEAIRKKIPLRKKIREKKRNQKASDLLKKKRRNNREENKKSSNTPQQSFDLVQLQPSNNLGQSTSTEAPIYPDLQGVSNEVNQSVPGPSGSLNNVNAVKSDISHEAKTAILPSVGASRTKHHHHHHHKSRRRPKTSSQTSPTASKDKGKSQQSKKHQSRRRSSVVKPEAGGTSSQPTTTVTTPPTIVKPTTSSGKPRLQIVYTPPFSVKVVTQQQKSENSQKQKSKSSRRENKVPTTTTTATAKPKIKKSASISSSFLQRRRRRRNNENNELTVLINSNNKNINDDNNSPMLTQY